MKAKRIRRGMLAILATMLTIGAEAQQVMRLWEGLAPGAKASDEYTETIVYADKLKTKPRVARVTDPTLTIYRPDNSVENKHIGIIICPGGGYGRLSYDVEGTHIAEALAKRGITGFVLKYRLPSDVIMEDRTFGPLSDAQRAIRTIRARAAEFGVDANKIGIMGFSAGGNLAATTSTLFGTAAYDAGKDTTSARPDFSVLGYPVVSLRKELTHMGTRMSLVGGKDNEEERAGLFSADENVSPLTPPAFIFHCSDDNAVPPTNSIRYFSALRANGVDAELHIFRKGGHGFGLGNGTRTMVWLDMMESWLSETILQ